MMNRLKQVILVAAGLLALVVIATLVAPNVRATLKGALVEVIIPSHPYSAQLSIPPGNTDAVAGPGGTATLGVTSITITNYNSTMEAVSVDSPQMSPPNSCSGTVTSGGRPYITMFLPAQTTMHFNYPTPLVFGPCVDVIVPGAHSFAVEFDINGIVN